MNSIGNEIDLVESGDTDKLVSVVYNTTEGITGGRDRETSEEIRDNAMAFFSAQDRAVTARDYASHALAMPSKYGSVSKVYIHDNDDIRQFSHESEEFIELSERLNPFNVNMFVLGYNANEHLTLLNAATKQNLRTFLNQKRILTDSVNIYDGFIVNIRVNFTVRAYKNFNKSLVLMECLESLQGKFDVKNWQIGQPIILADIYNELLRINGVQNVTNITIENVTDTGYSNFSYNIKDNIKNEIIYTSLDPMIFEVKFPTRDIQGEVI